MGFGYAYAFAEDNLCTIADSYVTVSAERSRYFGPDETWRFSGNGTVNNNLDSDFFYARINESGIVEDLMTRTPPEGPAPELKKLVRGYVAGYNAYLRDTGVANLPDPRCRGADWVRPITEIDVYRRFHQLGSLASAGVAIGGIGAAAPTLAAPLVADAEAEQRDALAVLTADPAAPGREAEEAGGTSFPWTVAPTRSASAARRRRTAPGWCSATRTSRGTAPSASTRPS